MININNYNDNKFRQSIYLIKKEAIRRGWAVYVPYNGSSILQYIKPSGAKILTMSTTPATSSYPAAYVANDKYATHAILDYEHLPVLSTSVYDPEDKDYDFSNLFTTLSADKLVVKPLDGGHGKGITVNINTTDQLKRAVDIALKNTNTIHKVVIQTMYRSPIDLRLLCINQTYVAAIARIPARVIGDGINTIKSLVEIENKNSNRGEAYVSELAEIDVDKVKNFLGGTIYRIPDLGEIVDVLGVANYGQGGETLDCTDQIPDWLIGYAEKASKVLGLYTCGVDFLVKTMPSKNASIEILEPVITEVNKAPSLYIHEYPTHGISRPVTKSFIDYLDTLF